MPDDPIAEATPDRTMTPAAETPRARDCIVLILILAFAAAAAYSVWSAPYVPFQDYPSHLFRVHVLAHYDDPAFGFSQYFVPNWGLTPNQLSDFIVFALARALPVDPAARVYFTLYIFLLPLSVFFFARRIAPGNGHYALAASLLTLNHFVLMANENFLSSLPVLFFFLGIWAHWRMRPAIRSTIARSPARRRARTGSRVRRSSAQRARR